MCGNSVPFFWFLIFLLFLLFLTFVYLKPLTPTQWHFPSSTSALVDFVGFCSDFHTLNYRLALTLTHIYHFAWRQHNSVGLAHLRARAFIHRLAEKSLIQWVRRGIACANWRHNITKTYEHTNIVILMWIYSSQYERTKSVYMYRHKAYVWPM